MIRPILNKTLYDPEKRIKPNISFFHTFGCKCYVLDNSKDSLEKFNSRSDEAIFLEYSTTSNTFQIFNKRTLIVEESVHVIFDEFNDLPFKNVSRDVGIEEGMKKLKITHGSQESQEKACKKDLQLEVVLPQLETQMEDVKNSNLSRE